jgi:hypothetical protein
MDEVDAGHHLEQLAGQVLRCSLSRRCHVDLAWVRFRVGNKFGNCLGRKRRVEVDNVGKSDQACNWCNVPHEIEIELFVEGRIDCVDRAAQQQRVAIGRRPNDRFGRYIGACARPIFDDELLAQPLREPLADQARSEVKVSAGGKADDDAHGP